MKLSRRDPETKQKVIRRLQEHLNEREEFIKDLLDQNRFYRMSIQTKIPDIDYQYFEILKKKRPLSH